MNKEKLERFKEEYLKALKEKWDIPDFEYNRRTTTPEIMCGKMTQAVIAGTFNKDGVAIKLAFTRLGVKPYTYKAINEWLRSTN